MIWSKNIRIIIIPVFLLVLSVIGDAVVVGVAFTSASRPTDVTLSWANYWSMMATNVVVMLYTTYNTVFIAGRLWWVGKAANRFIPAEEVKRNRYRGAISAVAQSGVMYLAVTIVLIVAAATQNQLNTFQAQMHRTQGHQPPPLATGATFKFASNRTSPEEEPAPTSAVDAVTSMGAYEYPSVPCPAADEDTSNPVRVTFAQGETSLSDQSATPTIPEEKGIDMATSSAPS
ncbi:hypothetical protein FRB93_011908 [Tulasnella sp. JGI-2019a]|nr:hypothetical protein FRB93_011908 [Tulasnella sp. JGI-2019a]